MSYFGSSIYGIPTSRYDGGDWQRGQRGTVTIGPAVVKSIDPSQRSTVRRDPRGWPDNPRLTGGTVRVASKEGTRQVSIAPVSDPLAESMTPVPGWHPR